MTLRLRAAAAALALGSASLVAAPVPAPMAQGLTAGEHLARIYRLALDADAASAEAALANGCAPAPREACDVVGLGAQWWQIFIDVDNRALDRAFFERAGRTIAAAEAWTAREPGRAEAWFYLGAAYGARVQLRAERREYFAAARDGKRIMASLDRALTLDPSLDDANFGSGLYKYYADIAPSILKFVRWLLALPGGDKVEGLEQMRRTRERGLLLRDDANFQLHQIYLWYEKQPEAALGLLEELRQRHPRNPMFPARIAQVYDAYRGDRRRALATYRELVEGDQRGAFNARPLAAALGRLGSAAMLQALGRPDEAMREWQAVVDARPSAPYGALARAHLSLGRLHQRAGRRDRARESFHAAIASAPPDDPHEVRALARRELARLR